MKATIDGSALKDLTAYLLKHESDIAYSINDFGDLSFVFHVVIGRQPKESPLR